MARFRDLSLIHAVIMLNIRSKNSSVVAEAAARIATAEANRAQHGE